MQGKMVLSLWRKQYENDYEIRSRAGKEKQSNKPLTACALWKAYWLSEGEGKVISPLDHRLSSS